MKLWKLIYLDGRGGAMSIVLAESKEHAISMAKAYGAKLEIECKFPAGTCSRWIDSAVVSELPFSPGVVGWVDA